MAFTSPSYLKIPFRLQATCVFLIYVLGLNIIVNTYYIYQVKADRKVSNSKSDLQGHSRSPAMVPFDRLHAIFYLSSVATMSLSCTVSEK